MYWRRVWVSLGVAYKVFRFMMSDGGDEMIGHFGASPDREVITLGILTARGRPAFDVHRFALDMERKHEWQEQKDQH